MTHQINMTYLELNPHPSQIAMIDSFDKFAAVKDGLPNQLSGVPEGTRDSMIDPSNSVGMTIPVGEHDQAHLDTMGLQDRRKSPDFMGARSFGASALSLVRSGSEKRQEKRQRDQENYLDRTKTERLQRW